MKEGLNIDRTSIRNEKEIPEDREVRLHEIRSRYRERTSTAKALPYNGITHFRARLTISELEVISQSLALLGKFIDQVYINN